MILNLATTYFFSLFLSVSVCWWLFCYIAGITDERIWNSFCLQYIWEFALGFLIAEELAKGRVFKINKTLLLIVAVVGIGLQAVMAMASDALRVFNDIPALSGYTALALLLMTVSPIDKGAAWLSTISYEYYLVHILVFETLFYFIEPIGLMSQASIGFVALVVAVVTAFIYHKAVLNYLYL